MTNRTVAQASVAIALLLMLLPAHATALHCNGDITTIAAGVETFHIDDRSDAEYPLNHWFYLESNGVAGLQSGGQGISLEPECGELVPFCFYDSCYHADPDTLIL